MTNDNLQPRIAQLEQICGVQQIMLRYLVDAVNRDHQKRTGSKAVTFTWSSSQSSAFNAANSLGGMS
jgi:hypothetical protein